jgi:hypothetical protein
MQARLGLELADGATGERTLLNRSHARSTGRMLIR